MIEQNNSTKDLNFYSQKSIGLASFIGGPMAAGYLIKENYKVLNEEEKGKKAFIISIIATLCIFGCMFILPEYIIEKIPSMVVPAVYTGIIYFIVEKIHGTILNKHLENDNTFHSGWRAAGIGFISLIIILITAVALIFGFPDKAYDAYEAEFDQFSKNEEATLVFYDHYDTEDNLSLLTELNDIAIPKWKDNIEIVKRSNKIEDLPSELIERNKHLLEYAELRLEAFELFKKSVTYDTDSYYDEIGRVHDEIDNILNTLNQ